MDQTSDQRTWWSRVTEFLNGSPAEGKQSSAAAVNLTTPRRLRLVVDTNIFIAAVRAPRSSSRRLLDEIAAGRASLLVSRPVFQEYQRILSKAVGSGERERLVRDWIGQAEVVKAGRGPRVVPEDSDDDKFVELARVGHADALVSNDRHLLDIADQLTVPIARPGEALRRLGSSSVANDR